MSGPEGVPFSKIEGGRPSFDHLHAEVSLVAALAQARLAATLDRLGPPGNARWDPAAGEVELRGRTFEAQQLGSFDGQSWLWSWGNPYLELPEAKTTFARSLRDRADELRVPAFAVPMIIARDERLPYMLGAFAIAFGAGEAYYLANQSQVYMLAPGQLDRSKEPPLDQLRKAIDAADAADVAYDLVRGLPRVAEVLGLEIVREERAMLARHGTSELRLPISREGRPLRTLALCFTSKQVTIDDVHAHLRAARGVSELPLVKLDDATLEIEGPGYAVRITRTDRLRDVMREASRTHDDAAKKYGAVLTVTTDASARYLGGLMAIVRQPFVGALWTPASAAGTGNGGPPVGPLVPYEAIQVCERLTKLPSSLVYDTLLRTPYPRG